MGGLLYSMRKEISSLVQQVCSPLMLPILMVMARRLIMAGCDIVTALAIKDTTSPNKEIIKTAVKEPETIGYIPVLICAPIN